MKITTLITVIRYLWAAFAAVPSALALINKIRAAFGNEKVQEVIKAFGEFIDKISPPAPTADSTGNAPANPARNRPAGEDRDTEKRRRLFRFRNRIQVAGMITDNEVQEYCAQHHIQSVDQQWA